MRLLTRTPLASGGRTPGTPDRCEYTLCCEPGAGELRGHLGARQGKTPWTMCAKHLRPEMHPADLRGKLFRWPPAGADA